MYSKILGWTASSSRPWRITCLNSALRLGRGGPVRVRPNVPALYVSAPSRLQLGQGRVARGDFPGFNSANRAIHPL
jgi:hypothetical protein